VEALRGDLLPRQPQSFVEFRAMVAEIAPAVLDAVASFMYGMTRLVDAMEAYGRGELADPASPKEQEREP
jgi:hypothetical protein